MSGFNELLYTNVHFAITWGNLEIAAVILEAAQKAGKLPVNEAMLKLLREPEALTDEEIKANANKSL